MMLIPESAIARLNVLNCTMGDMKVSFDGDNPEDVENAKAMIADLMEKGYLIFIETDEGTKRVHKFDSKTCEYIVREDKRRKPYRSRHEVKTNRIKAAGTKATAVARTGGG